MSLPVENNPTFSPEFLSGGGEMGQRIREFDWQLTPLGAVNTWPQSLRTCIRIMLSSSQPIWIGWGPQLIKFYNDPYKAIVGGKHPQALGKPASVVWKDIWRDIEPMLKKVMEEDEGTYVESQLLIMERNGYPEETYYTFSYTPIPGDDGGTAGMICFNTDDTYRIISERQLTTVTQLGKAVTDSKTDTEVITRTLQSLCQNIHDFPYALFYTYANNKILLADSTFDNGAHDYFPKEIDLQTSSALADAANNAVTAKTPILINVAADNSTLPKGPWEKNSSQAVVLPISQAGTKDPYGILLFGFNPYRLLDDNYSAFFSLIADQVATSFANVHVLEEERKRSEALAEIDRAKTTFFSNISHEFRTPLTLLLGPIEDVLSDPHTRPVNRERMELARRNAVRMQKLVNTLLEFSRIEAGRVEGKFTRVNIVGLTQDLVSTFRSAVEKAGMQLTLSNVADIYAYVDVDMWEKIVLNLVSNAFKYSSGGEIKVHVSKEGDVIHMSVHDTGIGIPEEHLDKIFNRFHRVENTEGRSQEGTGIGLAMVKELVKLHAGTITVSSVRGKGSTFTVTIPSGKDHLPPNKIIELQGEDGPILQNYAAYVEEAMKWLPSNGQPEIIQTEITPVLTSQQGNAKKQTIILADDNTDMREYVQRLLQSQFYVITAINGEDAYSKLLEYKPDLLLTDVMMPKVDGFELLKRVRSHPDVRNTPVIFLSARAGEEATIEGLEAGADDYVVKPFSAKELIGRVTNLIRINQVRRETEQQFYQLFLQTPAFINVFKGPEHRYEFFHPKNKEIFGDVDFTGMTIREAVPELAGQGIIEMMDEVYNSNKTIQYNERPVTFANSDGQKSGRYFNATYQPWYDLKGNVQGVLNFATDVTETVLTRKKVEESEKRFRNLVMQAPVSITVLMGDDLMVEIANDKYLELVGKKREDFVGKPLWEGLPEVKSQVYADILQAVLTTGNPYKGYEAEVLLVRNGIPENLFVDFIYSPLKDANDKIAGILVVAIDVTQQVLARKKIEQSEKSLLEMADAIPQLAWVANEQGRVTYVNNRIQEFAHILPDEHGTWKLGNLLHPDDKQLVANTWRTAVINGSAYQQENLMQMKDGTYRWHLTRAIPQKDEQGKVVKWFGTSTDIQDAKEQSAILENEVKKRTKELSKLNISLQKSNDDLQQFAHVASHDLKEPVRKVTTFTGRLLDEYGGLLPDKGKVFLDKIQQATQRMVMMIEGVLKYSTLNSSEQVIETVDLNEIIKNIETDLEVSIQQKHAVITKNNLPVIEGATVLIYQLFYNLLNNSLKFSQNTVRPVIQISSSVKNDGIQAYAAIEVRDNGIGFEKEYANTIFNTFTRLNAKDAYEGTGLGLALCKKITDRHHGSITATGAKNQGAIFNINLPLKQAGETI